MSGPIRSGGPPDRDAGIPEPVDPSAALVLLAGFLVGSILGLLLITLPLYIRQITGSDVLVGIVVALPFFADASMAFVWGGISDRLGNRRRPIQAGLLVGAIIFLLLPLAVVNLGLFLALRTLQVMFLSVSVVGVALVSELRPAQRGRATSELLGAGAVGVLAGVIASGPIADRFGMTGIFLAGAAVAFTACVLFFGVREPAKRQQTVGIREVLEVAARPALKPLLLVLLVLFVANSMDFAVAPLFMADEGFSRVELGLLSGVLVLSGAALMLGLGRLMDRYGRRPVIRLAPLILLLHWGGLALVLPSAAIAVLFASPAWPFLLAPAAAMATDATRVHERGRGTAAVNTFIGIGNTIGSVLGGAVTVFVGSYRGTFAVSVLFIIAGIVLVFRIPETLHRGPAAPSSGVDPPTVT